MVATNTIKMRLIKISFLFLTLFSLIISCRNPLINSNPQLKINSTTLGCEEYLSTPNDFGVLYNNVWNKNAAKDYTWTQCLEQKLFNDTITYGWSWQWPDNRNTGFWNSFLSKKVIFAYPQIKVGRSPWAPIPAIDDRFPLQISTTPQLCLSYNIKTVTNGQHNLATTMWIVNSPLKLQKADPSNIIAEFMIWTYATEKHMNPAGKKYAEIKIDEITWEVWSSKNWSDLSGINSNKWINITFRSKTNQLKAEFDILKLIQYAIQENILPTNLYIADLELGNEIMSGSGYTWVKSFKVY